MLHSSYTLPFFAVENVPIGTVLKYYLCRKNDCVVFLLFYTLSITVLILQVSNKSVLSAEQWYFTGNDCNQVQIENCEIVYTYKKLFVKVVYK